MGPTSFARMKYELKQLDPEKKPPSHAATYKESRKRKEGHNYQTPYEHVQNNINKMEEIEGLCDNDDGADSAAMKEGEKRSIKKRNKSSMGGFIIPEVFLNKYKDQIVKDTVGEVMKMFKKELEPEKFANLTRSLGYVTSRAEHTENINQDNDQDLNEVAPTNSTPSEWLLGSLRHKRVYTQQVYHKMNKDFSVLRVLALVGLSFLTSLLVHVFVFGLSFLFRTTVGFVAGDLFVIDAAVVSFA